METPSPNADGFTGTPERARRCLGDSTTVLLKPHSLEKERLRQHRWSYCGDAIPQPRQAAKPQKRILNFLWRITSGARSKRDHGAAAAVG